MAFHCRPKVKDPQQEVLQHKAWCRSWGWARTVMVYERIVPTWEPWKITVLWCFRWWDIRYTYYIYIYYIDWSSLYSYIYIIYIYINVCVILILISINWWLLFWLTDWYWLMMIYNTISARSNGLVGRVWANLAEIRWGRLGTEKRVRRTIMGN